MSSDSDVLCSMMKLGFCTLIAVLVSVMSGANALSLRLIRRSEPNGITLSGTVPPNFDRSKYTYVLLHGMGGSSTDNCMNSLTNALLQREDANVLVPDYRSSAFGYISAYRPIAQSIATFLIRNRISPINTTVMGQSLGAQAAGILHNYGFKPNNIIGLDPAGPNFQFLSQNSKLSRISANGVQAIHTNVGRLGSTTLDGDLDVYINSGRNFPCCSSDVCRHVGACYWMANTIRNGPSIASTCANQSQALAGTCRGSPVSTGFGRVTKSQGRTIAHITTNQCMRS